MSNPNDACLVLSTAPDLEQARSIVRALVEARLAACGNLVPGVQSIYRWQGAIEEAGEVLLVLKCTRARLAQLESALHRLHPYQTPEFVVLEASAVAAPYLAWLRAETD